MADFAKKLTVSFGAFSCTLSGFDDPFPVMSQVVDYFQALSKADPSFGAHPERPDTEALRVLAEKTSGLSVGAEMKGDEVILKSVEDSFDRESGDAAVDATPAPLPVEDTSAPEAVATIEAEPMLEDASAEESTAEESPIEDVATEIDEKPSEDIGNLVSQAFADAETEDIVNEIAADEATEPTSSEENSEIEKIDTFDHLQIEDLNDDVFANIDADAIFDAVAAPDSEEPASEDLTGYIDEAVVFSDIENPDLDLSWAASAATSDEDDISSELPAMDEVAEISLDGANDPVPVWEKELICDDPIEIIEEIDAPELGEVAEISLEPFENEDETQPTYDDHVDAENNALALILAATDEDETFGEVEPETPEDARNLAPSLVLGFGDQASLDATGEVTTGTLDTEPDHTAEALEALGMFEEDTGEFGWSADDDAPAEQAEPAPLLLTPMQAVPSIEDDIEVIDLTAPSSAIDMNQSDPRPDLRRFADAAGAASMTELLEASAAYRTLVSGRPNFSRGEVLDLLDEFCEEDGFSQEARIKTFGSLLRGGRIQSVGNGDYEMTLDALSDYEGARRAG